MLRCVLTLVEPGTHMKCQIFVFEITDGDWLYSVTNWPVELQDQLEDDLDVKKLKKLNYDVEITRALNA